ncbi:aldo/keto reductase [Rhodospirillum sp. A1_3_36]|uniref:aldo/keto reductase n=1 Tax=Rhodospirillum sp. A1_3_36 TaxID=3391666 RepID=UPI0039A591E0
MPPSQEQFPPLTLPGGLVVARLGLGTMGLGGRYDRDESGDADAIALIHRALERGVNLFDTASVYGDGHGEEVLGRALLGRRDQAIIATKFKPGQSRAEEVVAACEASLMRLGVDHIDLFQTHWPNPAVPLEDTLAGLTRLVEGGKVRAIGFSNTTVADVRRARALLPDGVAVASLQQDYSLVERFVEHGALPYCQGQGMALLAYSPLGQGRLARNGGSLLETMAADHGVAPGAVALRWLLSRKGVVPIPMTSSLRNLEANLAALDLVLSEDDIALLDRAFSVTIKDISVERIRVVASHTGKAYKRLEDARANTLDLSPSPAEVALELATGEMLKPVKVRPAEGADGEAGWYDLYEGQLRYWAWRIAHDDGKPITALIR